MTKPIDLAIIGLGEVSRAHLHAHGKLNNARFVAVVEPMEARRVDAAQKLDVPAFASVADMLKVMRPDAACVLTPVSTHAGIIAELAAAGVHLLSEKPLAVSVEDAIAIQEAVTKSGITFHYASSYRFLPGVLEARRLVSAGAIGQPRLLSEQHVAGRGLKAFKPAHMLHYPRSGPGGGMMGLCDHGIHLLDVMPWIASDQITSVCGIGNISGEAPKAEAALLRLAGGALCTLLYDEATYSSDLPSEGVFSGGQNWVEGEGFAGLPGLWEQSAGSIRIHGEEGAMRLFHYANKLVLNDIHGSREVALPQGAAPVHFLTQLQSFIDAVSRQSTTAVTLEDGLKALNVLLGIYRSQDSGRWEAV